MAVRISDRVEYSTYVVNGNYFECGHLITNRIVRLIDDNTGEIRSVELVDTEQVNPNKYRYLFK